MLILAEELEQLSANATSAPGGMTPGNLNVTVEAISLLGEITEMGSGNGTTTGSIEDDMLEEIVQVWDRISGHRLSIKTVFSGMGFPC